MNLVLELVPTIYLQGERSLLCYHAEVALQNDVGATVKYYDFRTCVVLLDRPVTIGCYTCCNAAPIYNFSYYWEVLHCSTCPKPTITGLLLDVI